MQRIAFSSDELPTGLDERGRLSLCREFYSARYGCRLDFSRPEDRPLSVRFEFARFGEVALGQFRGTLTRVGRGAREVAADGNDDFGIVLSRGKRIASRHRGREAELAPGMATLFNHSEAGEIHGQAENSWIALMVPRRRLLEVVADAEDLAGLPLDPSRPAVRHLRRYLDILLDPDAIGEEPALTEHVGATLLDLVALALGATREQEQLSRLRGMRAARLQEVLRHIRGGHARPDFSPQDVALTLGLSARYVQDLLQQSGASFTERVTEFRLQKARAMLSDAQHDRMKVIEIALACGFDNVSYFNRCFRRRFGASPTQYRGGRGDDWV